jgi:hypothetical protein
MKANLDTMAKDISDIQMVYLENNGFIPNIRFLNAIYKQGELNLTDSQENSLIQWFEISGID